MSPTSYRRQTTLTLTRHSTVSQRYPSSLEYISTYLYKNSLVEEESRPVNTPVLFEYEVKATHGA